jgi:hypothetical protein
MVTRQPDPGDDAQLRALTSLAGWRQFAGEVPAVPGLLDTATLKGLEQGKRDACDDDQIAHHPRLLVVRTGRLHHRPARRHLADDRGRVRPVPRHPGHPAGQHH